MVSRMLKEVGWKNTRIVRDVEDLRALKAQPGKDMHAVGGATLVSSLMNAGLIDELRIVVQPIVLGRGKALFEDVKERHALTLLDVKPLQSGMVRLDGTAPAVRHEGTTLLPSTRHAPSRNLPPASRNEARPCAERRRIVPGKRREVPGFASRDLTYGRHDFCGARGVRSARSPAVQADRLVHGGTPAPVSAAGERFGRQRSRTPDTCGRSMTSAIMAAICACLMAAGTTGVARYARVTPARAAWSDAASSKFPTAVSVVGGPVCGWRVRRTNARTLTPRASSRLRTTEPVFPVAPVTRIRSSFMVQKIIESRTRTAARQPPAG